MAIDLYGMQNTVFLTLRDTQLKFLSRSMSIPDYTNLTREIYQAACKLLHEHWDQSWSVRLVGITLSNLKPEDYVQYDLFGEKERQINLARVYDKICDRFGEHAIFRAISLTEVSLYAR